MFAKLSNSIHRYNLDEPYCACVYANNSMHREGCQCDMCLYEFSLACGCLYRRGKCEAEKKGWHAKLLCREAIYTDIQTQIFIEDNNQNDKQI